jgi:hypothetical protein
MLIEFALLTSLAASQACFGGSSSRPIVDVRFDAPYRQIEYSLCDSWTPTWGKDDVLYTGCDDGNNFGGIPDNPASFGKLEGSNPYQMRGTTINGLRDYREGQLFQQIDEYRFGGVTYRLGQCGSGADELESTCLVSTAGTRRLFTSQHFKSPSFIETAEGASKDAFRASPDECVFAVAYAGVIDGEDQYFVARAPKAKLPEGNATDWTFLDKEGAWVGNPEAAAPMINSRVTDSGGIN